MADLFLAVSNFIDSGYALVFPLLLLIAAFTVQRRAALLFALLIAVLAGPVLKDYYAQPRPCLGAPGCPSDYGLPSIHALGAAIFAVASLGSPAFIFFAPVAVVIAYSRIYLGYHSIEQVAAGFALAIAVYSLGMWARSTLRREKPFVQKQAREKKWGIAHELSRQAIHVLFGSTIIAIALLFGLHLAVIALTIALAVGLFALGLHMMGVAVPLAKEILDTFERKSVIPGKGAMHYAAGALLLLTFSPQNFALGMIAVLAFGDGASTVVGKLWGKANALPWNRKKSWAGTLAFAVVGLAASAFFLPLVQAAGYSVFLACVESLPVDVDDNLLVPVAAIAGRAVQAAMGL